MTAPSSSTPDLSTVPRILDAATALFAEHGYDKTTVRQICDAASVNVAAINYHFGDKQHLYYQVIAEAHRQTCARFPMEGEIPGDLSGEEKLRQFISVMLQRLFSQECSASFGRLMAHEMMQPTGALDQLVLQDIRPKSDILRAIVRDIAGVPLTDESVIYLAYSIIGQALFYKHAAPVVSRLSPQMQFGPEETARLADHITRFSVAGIHAIASAQPR